MVREKQQSSGRKERCEVLYEDAMSKIGLLAESVIGMKDEIKADIYEFKKDLKVDYSILEMAIRSNGKAIKELKEEVIINRKAIKGNGVKIEKNRTVIEKNRTAIEKNQKSIEKIDKKLDKHEFVIMEHEKKLAV